MIDRQVKTFPAHDCGAFPRMFERSGMPGIGYYVECGRCGVRTAIVEQASTAARLWSAGTVMRLQKTAA